MGGGKLMTFREFLNSKFEFNIIEVNQDLNLPSYPFSTMQIISEDRSGLSNESSVLINSGLDITETLSKRVESVAQFDVYGATIEQCRRTARTLIDGVVWVYRNDILDEGFGIIEVGDIVDNTSIEKVRSRYRLTVDVTFEYTDTSVRDIENMQSVIVDLDDGNIIVER